MKKLNPHISVDCVIFGFDSLQIKVLLVYRQINSENKKAKVETDLKLPGDFIRDTEDLQEAAERVLRELTGLENIYLRQFRTFGATNRINKKRDITWLLQTTGLSINRVVTVAYYSLIKIDESKQELVKKNNAVWVSLSAIDELAFDHKQILQSALQTVRERIQHEPIGFELLPQKFTIRHIQNLYEVIFGKTLDNRNFRKKILKTGYLVPLEEKQKNVAHKPARLYRFNRKIFN